MFCIFLYCCLHSFFVFFRISCRMMSVPKCQRFTDSRVRSAHNRVLFPSIASLSMEQDCCGLCKYSTIFVHFVVQLCCSFLLHTDVNQSWYSVVWYFQIVVCLAAELIGHAVSHVCLNVCVYIYRTSKGVETGGHPTGRPAEGSAEKQHQYGEEARIWEVNTSTGGLSQTQKKGSCFLCTSVPTFGNG